MLPSIMRSVQQSKEITPKRRSKYKFRNKQPKVVGPKYFPNISRVKSWSRPGAGIYPGNKYSETFSLNLINWKPM